MKIETRKTPIIKIMISEHAQNRWVERAGRPLGGLKRLLLVKLRNHLSCGLTIHHGRALLPLNAGELDMPQDLVACLDLPDWKGVWRVVTFLPDPKK